MDLFQLSNQTKEDRFPKIFRAARKAMPAPQSILSFGCSTGFECFTLRKYFPEAPILGYDLNPYVIPAACAYRTMQGVQNVRFTSTLKPGTFDMIFALMVFFSIESPIPEDKFYPAVNGLANRVNPGGVIAFHNLEHPFTHVAFRPIRQWQHTNSRNRTGKIYSGGLFRRV